MGFVEIKPEEIKDNPFDMIGKQWMLITAGDEEKCNTMTASWGGLGVIWNRPTATAYIRQCRYTKEFVDNSEYFTLTVFDESYRDALRYLGTVSGKDEDKIAKTGLTPYYVDGTVGFEEAKMILVCKKVYEQYMGPENFVYQETIERCYPDNCFHTMYLGEITKVLIKED